MTTYVRAAVLTNYLEVSQHLGLNAFDLLADDGLSKAQLQHPEQRIPLEATVLSRCFIGQFGMSPSTWRSRNKGPRVAG